MAKKKLEEMKDQLVLLKSITPWEDVKENEIYHIPPIGALSRRKVLILSKEDDKASYRKLGGTEQDEKVMYRTSVFAKFLVKERKF